jgi:hypothetical protein
MAAGQLGTLGMDGAPGHKENPEAVRIEKHSSYLRFYYASVINNTQSIVPSSMCHGFSNPKSTAAVAEGSPRDLFKDTSMSALSPTLPSPLTITDDLNLESEPNVNSRCDFNLEGMVGVAGQTHLGYKSTVTC